MYECARVCRSFVICGLSCKNVLPRIVFCRLFIRTKSICSENYEFQKYVTQLPTIPQKILLDQRFLIKRM